MGTFSQGKSGQNKRWGALLFVTLGAAGCRPTEQVTRTDERAASAASASGSGPGAGRLGPPGLPAPSASAAPPNRHEKSVSDAAWLTSTGRWAIVHGSSLDLVDPATGAAQPIAPHAGEISHLAVAPRGDLFALTAGDGYLGVWRADGSLVGTIPGAKTTDASALTLSPDGSLVALQGPERLGVWEVATGKPIANAESPGQLWSMAFHTDGHHLVLVSMSGAQSFDWKKGIFEGDPQGTDTGGTFATVVSPDGRWVAAAADSGHTLRVWQTIPWRRVATLGTAENCQNHISAVFTPDGRFLQGNSGRAWVRSFEPGSWRVVRSWKPTSKGEIESATLSMDGQVGLIAEESVSHVIDLKTGALLGSLTAPGSSSQLSPDGRWLLHYESEGYSIHETRGMRRTASWGQPAPGAQD